MSELNRVFVSFDTLEGLLDTHDRARPLYFAVRCVRRPTKTHAFVSCETFLLVSDVQDGVARYWYSTIGRHQELGGEPMDRELVHLIARRAMAANEQVRDFLRTRCGCDIREAGISFPEDLRLSEGTTELLRYDRETGCYRFGPLPVAAPEFSSTLDGSA